jgi:hypothetical protein
MHSDNVALASATDMLFSIMTSIYGRYDNYDQNVELQNYGHSLGNFSEKATLQFSHKE